MQYICNSRSVAEPYLPWPHSDGAQDHLARGSAEREAVQAIVETSGKPGATLGVARGYTAIELVHACGSGA
jgi:hypothetical protein